MKGAFAGARAADVLRWPLSQRGGIEVGYPVDSNLRGLARATFQSDIPPWEYDIRAVAPGTDPVRISDWHRRHGRASNKNRNIERAAEALAESLPEPQPATKAPGRGRR